MVALCCGPGNLEGQNVDATMLLTGALEEAEGLGLVPLEHLFSGSLGSDSAAEHWVTLPGGGAYAIGGACESDCSDVDLFVYDGVGRELASDQTPQGVALASFTTSKAASRYRIRVRLYRCSSDPCDYAVRAFRDPDPPPDGAPAGGYESQVLELLSEAAAEPLEARGFELVGPARAGLLDEGTNEDLELDFDGEGTWAVLGVCDEDCGDLDLSLHDGEDNELTADRTTDAEPLVWLLDEPAGRYRINVRMYTCSVEPCYYAVGVYRVGTLLDDGRDQDAVRARLVSAGHRLLEGANPPSGDEVHSGRLPDGEDEDVYVFLEGGREYTVLGVCDEICGDLDLFVYGPDDDQLDSDVLTNAEPTVTVVPESSGEYRVRVRMYACSAPSCYYAVGAYER